MNALILAAGYATRLYPLTLNKAKPLLEVAGKPIIEWVIDSLLEIPKLGTIYIVTNDKFAPDFQNWANRYQKRHRQPKIRIVNDGSKSDEDKLGAIGDINLILTRENLGTDDLLIVAGDNLFHTSLKGFVKAAAKAQAMVAVYDVGNLEAMKKYGAVTVDTNGTITHFEEKPEKPKSTLAAVALYYYSREILPLFTTYLAAGTIPTSRAFFSSGFIPGRL
jgi:glucose-1-phosphate thymidylyltransferase